MQPLPCIGRCLVTQAHLDAMSARQATWEQLPLGVQERILVLTGSPCARRVSKAWRGAFDAANDTLCFSHVPGKSLEAGATAAATRVVRNSASLTAINIVEQEYGYFTPPPLMLSDLLAAGATSGLANRLRKLTVRNVTAACAVQQLQALRQCTSLTHLDIKYSDLQHCQTVELTAALQAMPRLTCLHMCSCKLPSQGGVAALTSALQPLTQLQHLHLARTCIGAPALAALAPALSAMPGLQTLDLSSNLSYSPLDQVDHAKALCTLLGVVPGLTHLDVSYRPLHDQGTALLAKVLQGMTRLQTLNMSYTSIGDEGMATLVPALAALPHLHTLDLQYTESGPMSASALQPVLARECSPLRELRLGFGMLRFTLKGAHSLASGLSTATRLQGLALGHARLGDEGWVALAPALSCLGPSLQWLELGRHGVDAVGSVALASALKALTGLTCLKAMSFFTPAAMVTISAALTGVRRLRVLGLSAHSVAGYAMSAEVTAAFAAALPALAGSLQHLTLSFYRIDVEAAANALAPALAQATGLIELRLGNNDLGPQGAQWLVPVLSALPYLRKVFLGACDLGVQGCLAVAHALKDRDGTLVDLAGNGVISSTEGDELWNIPGIRIGL